MNVYKEALKLNVSFPTERGVVSLAGLFKLPLSSNKQGVVSLDGLYSELVTQKATFNTNSYLGNTNNKALIEVDVKLEVLKDIMDTKLADLASANTRATLMAKRDALRAEQANRIATAPTKLTDEQVTAQLLALEEELA